MALSCTRLLCRPRLNTHSFRALYTSSFLKISSSPSTRTSSDDCESYDEKNMRLERPMSPHLTIYKPQLTAVMSVSHRGTGIILAGYAMTAAFATLFICDGVLGVVDTINGWCLPLPLIFLAKVFLAFPAMYHYFNGIRHIAWDLGMFLTIKDVYRTGYAVVGISAITAVVLGFL